MTRAAIQSEVFNPDQAVPAGFLDEVVEASELDARALAVATQLAQLPQAAYAANKLLTRGKTLAAMKAATESTISQVNISK